MSTNQETCTHTRKVGGEWVDNPYHDAEEWELNGYDAGPKRWEEGHTATTVKDIDLHRYKCTQCGKIMYYSEAARRYYEEGVTSNIKGLDGK